LRVLLLGVGNVLLSDEGLGVRLVEELRRRYRFSPDVELIDGGTLGIDLLYFIEGFDRLLLVDAVLGGSPPGTLYRFEGEEVKAYFRKKVSAHELGIQEVLAIAQMLGKAPKEIVLLGMEPESLEISLELSESVRSRFEELISAVLRELERWGVSYERVEPAGV